MPSTEGPALTWLSYERYISDSRTAGTGTDNPFIHIMLSLVAILMLLAVPIVDHKDPLLRSPSVMLHMM